MGNVRIVSVTWLISDFGFSISDLVYVAALKHSIIHSIIETKSR